ncbi:MAG: ABC transporter substrate-binding protein [Gemmatimonadota bacterium]
MSARDEPAAAGSARRLRIATRMCLLGLAWACEREPRDIAREPAAEIAGAQLPARIVSLAPSVTEVLFAVGAGERVVGVDAFSDHPAAARRLPKLGGLLDPDVEGMLRLRPDLVVLLPAQEEIGQALRQAGVPTLAVPHEELRDVSAAVRMVGARVGRRAAAAALADSLARALDRERVRRPEEHRPRVLFVVAREPGQVARFTAAGPRTYIGELIELAGGRNALDPGPVRYPQLSAESALRLGPDVLLEWSGEDAAGGAAEDWERLEHLAAVRNGRVHVLRDEVWLRPGPRVVEALMRLKPLLRP